jgi:hypothetical protein
VLDAFQSDPEVVQAAVKMVATVLGPPSDASTKKIARWEHGGLWVNVHRESRKTVTVWIAGNGVTEAGELRLSIGAPMTPGLAPKNSNCSPTVKRGPTLFAYASSSSTH